MIVEGEILERVPGGAVVRTFIAGEGQRRFFAELPADSPITAGNRVSLEVDLEAVTARVVEVVARPL